MNIDKLLEEIKDIEEFDRAKKEREKLESVFYPGDLVEITERIVLPPIDFGLRPSLQRNYGIILAEAGERIMILFDNCWGNEGQYSGITKNRRIISEIPGSKLKLIERGHIDKL